MLHHGYARAMVTAAIGSTIACGSPGPLPTATTINRSSISIVGLTATVQPLTTAPQPGLLYLLNYQLRESGGRIGATAVAQHFAFSNGASADGSFNTQTPAHVAPGGTIALQSTDTIYPAMVPASHVTFTITYTDDTGQSGTATAESDISRIGV